MIDVAMNLFIKFGTRRETRGLREGLREEEEES
jgi:hypothetical protein